MFGQTVLSLRSCYREYAFSYLP